MQRVIAGKRCSREFCLNQRDRAPLCQPTSAIAADTQVKDLKPFESIPGPRPLPLVGNLWRYAIGMVHFKVQLAQFAFFSCIKK